MRPKVLIVGGGAAGAGIANELAGSDRDLTILAPDGLNEGATAHNQKWQHSGLLFPDEDVAANLWREFSRMRADDRAAGEARFLALRTGTIPTRLAMWERWHHFDEFAGFLSLGGHLDVGLPTAAVDGLLVPDRVADFRGRAVDIRRQVPSTSGHAGQILLDGDRVVGVETHDGSRIVADSVIVAVGAWTQRLLDASGVALPLPLVLKKCVVLSFEPRDDWLLRGVTVCLDVQKGVDSHGEPQFGDVTLVPSEGRLLAAGMDFQETSDPDDRYASPSQVEALLAELAQCFPDVVAQPYRVNVCIKTERRTGLGDAPDVGMYIVTEDQVLRYDKTVMNVGHGRRDLIVAIPGKASLMSALGRQVASLV